MPDQVRHDMIFLGCCTEGEEMNPFPLLLVNRLFQVIYSAIRFSAGQILWDEA